ncbi:NADH dehydrogenase [ubiquinone] 1 beta subcomplex subunit 2, mitochondrial [Cryptotermes secundus]|uniref:NADH dehydrogenase [ubiquinone] 1 beta subcomplex subunit 2, mitochondrial n=1 Tax=Cryptotermes secundus TaxID=105785 RepID=A0A2J7Q2X6_9NEOP|nr:NADH dehydrogenase [ubiquinone] 1 beta subcomplex subunit 2, mitochondrial [Cryptotermes secundus]PNF22928.1 NADH dehydrogenase [ubiquinone] 1 beta subcomplex subunit 2, mitochondrial [Cryptotermes secundus]
MLVSRGAGPLRCIFTKLNQSNLRQGTQPIRKGHDAVWTYRQPVPPPPKYVRVLAECVGGYMWWWIFWHLWHEPEHITGEFEYPDPSKWTDEELGIPPDDEE